jgi:general secretion pathway protein H
MPISATGNKAENGFTPLRRSAENGFTPLRRSAENGFTLIELMVVVTIIALASAVVVFAIPDPRGRVIDEAERFAARTLAARDDAIVQSRDVRILITTSGYSVERRRRGQWQAVTEKPFRAAIWQPGTGVEIGTSGRQAITFDATGAPASPALLTLVRDNARATVSVSGNGDIRVGS